MRKNTQQATYRGSSTASGRPRHSENRGWVFCGITEYAPRGGLVRLHTWLETFTAWPAVDDRLVLRDLFATNDFVTQEGGGVYLSAAALRRLLDYYERWMGSPRRAGQAEGPPFRELVRREARRFISYLRGQCELQLYRFGGEEDGAACDISSVTI